MLIANSHGLTKSRCIVKSKSSSFWFNNTKKLMCRVDCRMISVHNAHVSHSKWKKKCVFSFFFLSSFEYGRQSNIFIRWNSTCFDFSTFSNSHNYTSEQKRYQHMDDYVSPVFQPESVCVPNNYFELNHQNKFESCVHVSWSFTNIHRISSFHMPSIATSFGSYKRA